MEDSHERIEHFRRHSFVDVLILLKVHMLWCAARNATLEYVIGKLHNLLLVHNPIVIVDVFTLFIMIEPLPLLLSLHFTRWGCHSTRVEVIQTFVVDH